MRLIFCLINLEIKEIFGKDIFGGSDIRIIFNNNCLDMYSHIEVYQLNASMNKECSDARSESDIPYSCIKNFGLFDLVE